MWRRPVGEVGVKRRYGAMTAGSLQFEEECFLAVALFVLRAAVGGNYPEEAHQLQIARALIAAELVGARIDSAVVKSGRGRPLMFEVFETEEAWNDFRFSKTSGGCLQSFSFRCQYKSRFPEATALLLLLRRLRYAILFLKCNT